MIRRSIPAVVLALAAPARAGDDADSFDQAKIADAFAHADAGSLVMTNEHGAADGCRFEPGDYNKEQEPRVQAKSLPHGARVGFNPSGGVEVEFVDSRRGVPAGTPGLAWTTVQRLGAGTQTVFVTFDGGRYTCTNGALVPWDASGAIPAPLAASGLSLAELDALAKRGQIPAKQAQALADTRAAAEACTTRVSKQYDPKFEALAAADLREDTRQARQDQLRDAFDRALTATCGNPLAKVQAAWSDAVSAHEALRHKTADAFAARFKPGTRP